MKKMLLASLALYLCSLASVPALDTIKLPEPDKTGGMTLSKALAERHTSRDFADVDLSPQQMSDLLWSTAGQNRPEGKKVYPVSMNRQDMAVYVVNRQGVYRYDPSAHTLIPVIGGDHRAKTGTQPYVATAAVNLAYVQDMMLWQDSPQHLERGRDWGFTHAGAMTQNAYLYASGQGWSAVIRGMFDQNDMKELLQLSDEQFVRVVHSIGPKP
jgi:Nitroreductase